MSFYEGLASFTARLFGRREAPSPAEAWLARRERATPEEVIRAYFDATVAHDLDWMLGTMTPERARLYNEPRTVDRRRKTILSGSVLSVAPAQELVPLPPFAHRYRSHLLLRVEFELTLVPPDKRRDPSLRDGPDWAYFVLVTESRGKPWLIADWGR